MSYDCTDAVNEIGAALREQGVPMVDPNDDSGHGLAEVSVLARLCIELYPLVRSVLAEYGRDGEALSALGAGVDKIDGAAEILAAEYDV